MTIDTTTTSPLAAVLDATERAVHADPTAAAALFKASGSSTGPVTTTIGLGRHTVQTDEPASLGGQDSVPNPVEYAPGRPAVLPGRHLPVLGRQARHRGRGHRHLDRG